MALNPMKRRRTTQACFLCEKHNIVECNGVRPCNVCLRRGYPQMCYGASLTSPTSTELTPASERAAPKAQEPSRGHEQQDNFNQYLINEIKKMKETQDSLMRQMERMRLENERLETKVHSLESQTRELVAITPSRSRAVEPVHDGNLSVVVYDLTQQPPTVQTANPYFCEMLGYRMSEVINKPWQTFIHPDFVSRTVEALERSSPRQNIELTQCYKHKLGGYFLANETYNIFTDEHDKPLSVLVYIKPQQDIRSLDSNAGSGMRREPTANQQRIEYLSPSQPSPSFSTPTSSPYRHIQPKASYEPILSPHGTSHSDAIFEDITTPSPNHTSPAVPTPSPSLGLSPPPPDWHWLPNDTNFLDLLAEDDSGGAQNPTHDSAGPGSPRLSDDVLHLDHELEALLKSDKD